MKRLICIVAGLASCYPHYHAEPYRPVGCGLAEIVWLESVPEVEPLDAACAEYTRRTGRRSRDLLEETVLYVRRHDGDPLYCEGTPIETCTMRVSQGVYVIEYREDLTRAHNLWHEMLHVLLFEAGHPGKTHHRVMRERGWCAMAQCL